MSHGFNLCLGITQLSCIDCGELLSHITYHSVTQFHIHTCSLTFENWLQVGGLVLLLDFRLLSLSQLIHMGSWTSLLFLSTMKRRAPSFGTFVWKCFRDFGISQKYQRGLGISPQIRWAFEPAVGGSSRPSELGSGLESVLSSRSSASQTSNGRSLCPSQRERGGHHRYLAQSSCHSTSPAQGLWSHWRTEPWLQVTMPNGKDMHARSQDAWWERRARCLWPPHRWACGSGARGVYLFRKPNFQLSHILA